jgi:hypothetical protein
MIRPGQTLNLPGGGTHTVSSGETLSGIASSYGGGSSSTPTPPNKPTEYGGSPGSSNWTPPAEIRGQGGGASGSALDPHGFAQGSTAGGQSNASQGWADPGKINYSANNSSEAGGEDDADQLHDNPRIAQILRAMLDMSPDEQDELVEALHGLRAESMAGDEPPQWPGRPNVGGKPTPPRPGVNERARGAMDSARYARNQTAFFDAFPDAKRIVNRGY